MARTIADSGYEAVGGTYDSSSKQFFDGVAESLISELMPFLKSLKSSGSIRRVKPKGKYIEFYVETNTGSGFGPRGEDDYVPAADKMDGVLAQVPYQRGIKGRIGMTFEAMQFGKEGVGGFVDMKKQEMKGALLTMQQQAIPMIWGVGDGVIAKIKEQNGVTTGEAYSTETYADCYPGTRWMADGMKLIGVQAPGANYAADSDMTAAKELLAPTSDTGFEWAAAVTCGNADSADRYLVEHHCADTGNATETTKGSVTIGTASSYRGSLGVTAMCDDSEQNFIASYCGINEALYPQWSAVVNHNSGVARAVSLDLFYRLYWKLTRKAGTFAPKIECWTNSDVHREVTELLEHFVEFKPRQLRPGFDEYDMVINGVNIPFKIDHACPSYIHFLNMPKITFAQGCPPQIAKETGSQWRQVTDKDKYEVFYRWIFQLYTKQRNAHGVIRDLDVEIASI
ncbi:MAG: phage major capsid protein [Pirellulaceae bacterium]